MAIRRAVAVGIIVVVGACSGTPAHTTTIPLSSTTTTEPTTTTTTEPEPLTAKEAFDLVSPALAFVETELGAGSAVLLPGEKVVTNAHVMWPYESGRVVFPDGTEILDAPVVAWDFMADLAVLDISDADSLPEPPVFADGTELSNGTPMFLIGYPAESERFPTPTITQGVLSRLRAWSEADLVYLQTDATIVGGQSGGALVSEEGEIIGISGLGLEEFALALAGTTVLDRVERLLAGEDVAGLGDRRLPLLGGGQTSVTASVPHFVAEAVWILLGENGTTFEATASSSADIAVALIAPDGVVEASVDDTSVGDEFLSVELVLNGPYFLAVSPFTSGEAKFTVTSTNELLPFPDPDHGQALEVDHVYSFNGDYPGDLDWFTIELEAGQSIVVSVSSTNIDPAVLIDRQDNLGEPLASDDDSGGGVLGTDAEASYTAEEAGTYLISVVDATQFGPGGYIISIESA